MMEDSKFEELLRSHQHLSVMDMAQLTLVTAKVESNVYREARDFIDSYHKFTNYLEDKGITCQQ